MDQPGHRAEERAVTDSEGRWEGFRAVGLRLEWKTGRNQPRGRGLWVWEAAFVCTGLESRTEGAEETSGNRADANPEYKFQRADEAGPGAVPRSQSKNLCFNSGWHSLILDLSFLSSGALGQSLLLCLHQNFSSFTLNMSFHAILSCLCVGVGWVSVLQLKSEVSLRTIPQERSALVWSQSLTGPKLTDLDILDEGQWILRISLLLLPLAGMTRTCLHVRFLNFYLFFAWVLMFNLKSFCLFSKHFIDWVVLVGPLPLSKIRSYNTTLSWWSFCASLSRAGTAGASPCAWFTGGASLPKAACSSCA